jgi:hypothetical protein
LPKKWFSGFLKLTGTLITNKEKNMEDLVQISRGELLRYQAIEKAAKDVISPDNVTYGVKDVEITEKSWAELRKAVETPVNSYANIWADDGK